MNRRQPSHNFDNEVISCLEHQIIPAWERHGMGHFAVNCETLSAFRKQPLPEAMSAWPRKRKSKGAPQRKRAYRGSNKLKVWEEEDQLSARYPDLIYVRSGTAEMRFGNYMVRCPEEHFLLLSPIVWRPAGKTPHFEEPHEGKYCEMWKFNTLGGRDHTSLSVCYSEGATHRNSGQYYIVNDVHVAQLFQIFVQEVTDKLEQYQKTGFGLLQSFFTLFLREIKAGRFYNRGTNIPPAKTQRLESPIEMARQYIDKNLNRPLTIDIVAQAVFMTRTNFIREFKEETGQTFSQYLIERRMAEARYWLLHDSSSIKAISHYVGLKHSRFHQLFQEHFGTSPAEFRMQQKISDKALPKG